MHLRVHPVTCSEDWNLNLRQISSAVKHRPRTLATPDPVTGEGFVVKMLLEQLLITETFNFSVLLRNDDVVEPMLLESRMPQATLSAHISV